MVSVRWLNFNDLLRVAKMPRYKEIKRNYHEAKEAILPLYKKNKKGLSPVQYWAQYLS